MGLNPWETAYLVTFTGETLNGKLHFFCSANIRSSQPMKPFHANAPFLHPLKTSENQRFSGGTETTLARNGLNMFLNNNWTIRQVKV